MRKKIIAAAAVQIAAALLLLTVTPLWSYALEKYGADYTVNSTSTWCEPDYSRAGRFMFFIDCDDVSVEGLEHPAREYTDTTDSELMYLYMGGNKNNVNVHLTYYIKDKALSRKLNELFDAEDKNYDAFELREILDLRAKVKNTVYSVNVRVFGTRVKLISVMADGKDVEAYLSELLGV